MSVQTAAVCIPMRLCPALGHLKALRLSAFSGPSRRLASYRGGLGCPSAIECRGWGGVWYSLRPAGPVPTEDRTDRPRRISRRTRRGSGFRAGLAKAARKRFPALLASLQAATSPCRRKFCMMPASALLLAGTLRHRRERKARSFQKRLPCQWSLFY